MPWAEAQTWVCATLAKESYPCRQPQLAGWAHEQLCWYSAAHDLIRGEGTTEKTEGFGALSLPCLRCNRKLQEQIWASASHMKLLNCFIIAFFIIRYFYLLPRKLTCIWHFHCYLLWSNNITAIQNSILHLQIL